MYLHFAHIWVAVDIKIRFLYYLCSLFQFQLMRFSKFRFNFSFFFLSSVFVEIYFVFARAQSLANKQKWAKYLVRESLPPPPPHLQWRWCWWKCRKRIISWEFCVYFSFHFSFYVIGLPNHVKCWDVGFFCNSTLSACV